MSQTETSRSRDVADGGAVSLEAPSPFPSGCSTSRSALKRSVGPAVPRRNPEDPPAAVAKSGVAEVLIEQHSGDDPQVDRRVSACERTFVLVPVDPSLGLTEEDEIVTRPNPNRFTTFPIQYPALWELYKSAQANAWTVEDIDMAVDVKHWNDRLTENEREYITQVLAFFASADGIVMENLACRFLAEVQLSEARSFLSFQICNESVHGEMYSGAIDALITDQRRRQEIFESVNLLRTIESKREWAKRWLSSSAPFAVRLAAFVIVEGLFFSGSFCAIYWLKHKGLMPGLCESNDWISRDEGMHCDHGIALFSMLFFRPTEQDMHAMMEEALAIEVDFVCEALPVDLVGMNKREMAKYVAYVADHLLKRLGYRHLGNQERPAENPFPWMQEISMPSKNNQFEVRGSYQKPGVNGGKINSRRFEINAEGW